MCTTSIIYTLHTPCMRLVNTILLLPPQLFIINLYIASYNIGPCKYMSSVLDPGAVHGYLGKRSQCKLQIEGQDQFRPHWSARCSNPM